MDISKSASPKPARPGQVSSVCVLLHPPPFCCGSLRQTCLHKYQKHSVLVPSSHFSTLVCKIRVSAWNIGNRKEDLGMAAVEESNPLLPNAMPKAHEDEGSHFQESGKENPEWTVNGLPLGHGNVLGAPVERSQWDSSIFACLGRNDEFCSSDLEVCLMGSVAPCMLYGSNVERLSSTPGTFSNHCLPYSSLYILGNFLFGWNCLAPWFSYPSRIAIRRKFNLEGTCEALSRSCGCCQGIMEDEEQREQCESACDFATHFFCHRCALCQEGRELRRRLPHPGFNGRSVVVMLPPMEQTMGRDV